MKHLHWMAAVAAVCFLGACDTETVSKGEPAGKFSAVDLGLSVKWATCNVGASSPEAFGDFFAWDETDDPWGTGWRTPTYDEWEELVLRCSCRMAKYRGVDGFRFQAANGNSIFLPAAGCRGGDETPVPNCYWSSDAYEYDAAMAYALLVGEYDCSLVNVARSLQCPVRAVRK